MKTVFSSKKELIKVIPNYTSKRKSGKELSENERFEYAYEVGYRVENNQVILPSSKPNNSNKEIKTFHPNFFIIKSNNIVYLYKSVEIKNEKFIHFCKQKVSKVNEIPFHKEITNIQKNFTMDVNTLKEIIKVIANRIKDLKGMASNQTDEKKKLDYLTRVEEQQQTQIALQEALLKEITNKHK